MADATINVKLQAEYDKATADIKTLKDKGAVKNVPNAERDFNELTKTLADLLKVTNPTKKQLREIATTFKAIDDLIKKVSDTVRTESKELANIEKEQVKTSKELAKAQERLSSLQKRGTEGGKLRKSYVEDQIKGITYGSGAHEGKQVSVDSFMKNGKEGKFNQYADPEAAKKIYESLQKTEMGLTAEYQKVNETIDKLKEKLHELEEAAKAAVVTGDDKIHADATARTGNVSTMIQDEINTRESVESVGDEVVDIENTNLALQKQTTTLGKAFKAFSIYTFAIRTARKALSEAAKTIKEVDRALTEQAMVTGLTRKQTYGLLKDYQDMASRLGSTTKEVSSTMTEFLRQGRSIAEATKLTEAAVASAKVAGISAADSINYLTTAINGFQLSADEAMKVSDKFAAVAATAATSYEEIAIALSKVAAQANLAGMSIDYTTALLTKGIETTREAPETIGTALKTVIARMRELTDYGETLEGDTNINNVEAQLGYIGIQLRDNNGELRSTEDVLNDLGAQWDDLNANQQAAIAKALAGTRQQSRLIAMMSDYERVIELQQVAERSQGATMAQMATYMEGMDAALNKVSVAWEKIVSAVANSEVIIGIINWFADLLTKVGEFLDSTAGMVVAITAISLLTANIVAKKVMEIELSRKQQKIAIQEKRLKLEQNKVQAQINIEELKNLKTLQKKELSALKKLKTTLKEKKATGEITPEEEEVLRTIDLQIKAKQNEIKETDLEIKKNKTIIESYNEQSQLLSTQEGLIGNIGTSILGLLTPIYAVFAALKLIKGVMTAIGVIADKERRKELIGSVKQIAVNAIQAAGKIISQLGVWGIPIAIGVAAALGVGIGLAVHKQNEYNNSAEKAVADVNSLSKAIFDLNKKFNALDTAIDKFDDLDNKIIKTKDDLKEMSEILDSAADSLTDEEKEYYESLQTDREKRNYLEEIKNRTNSQLEAKRQQQRNTITGLRNRGGSEWREFLTSNRGEYAQARDAMYALNNATLYSYIDKLKQTTHWSDEAATATQRLTQAMLESLDPQKAAELLDNPAKIQKYVDTIARVQASYTDTNGNAVVTTAASILDSDDRTIKERVEAFRELKTAIEALGDPEVTKAFMEANNNWAMLSEAFTNNALEYMDRIGATNKAINEFADSIQKLGYNSQEAAQKLSQLFDLMEEGETIGDAIQDIFGYAVGSEEYKKMLDAFDKNFGTTVLNMGQTMDKFKNSIDDLYKKAGEWATMSETDRTSFIEEHKDLFTGPQGQELLKAFYSGNYETIRQAMEASDALEKQRLRILEDINRQLEIEYARAEDERDHAYIAELERYKRELENTKSLYLVSIQTLYEQQQAQLDMYKEMLQKENDALIEALEKRKEAYEKYFEAINKEKEDEEYEEQAQLLMANISKLSSSTNADATAKSANLQKQLEDLEKERLETLRERAQEAILQNMEDEISKIEDTLEKLLNNEQALLNAMVNDTKDGASLIASMLLSKAATGENAEYTLQSYLEQIRGTFASIMPDINWDDVEVERRGDTTILNIEGKEIVLTEGEQQTVADAVAEALKQIGKR